MEDVTTIMTFTPDNRLAGLLRIPADVRLASITPEMQEGINKLKEEITTAGFGISDLLRG